MKVGKEPLDSTTKLVSVLGRLKEIRYWDTAGVVVPWAWTDRFMVTTDHDAWEIIGPETLKFLSYPWDGTPGRPIGTFCLGQLLWLIQNERPEYFVPSGRCPATGSDTSGRGRAQWGQSDRLAQDLSGVSVEEVVSALWA